MRNSIIGKLHLTRPELAITEELVVQVEDDKIKIIDCAELADELSFDENEEITKERLIELSEQADKIFEIMLPIKEDFEAVKALNLKFEDKFILIDALFKTARYEDLEVKEGERFQ